MNSRKLRIYDPKRSSFADDSFDPSISQLAQPLTVPGVKVTVAQVLPLLADAMASKRRWLQDFHDDSITIPQDLYEVLLAYQRMRSSDAA